MTAHADHIRGLTVYERNPAGGGSRIVRVELCPGALVYAYTICASLLPEVVWDDDEPLALLHLQDSTIKVYNTCCGAICHDLPGLKWPAYARLEIAPGVRVSMTLTYGNCA